MRSLGKTPNDPQIKSMSYIQWIWCYSNIIEDKKEEESVWRNRFKYMGIFINPETVRQIDDYERILQRQNMPNNNKTNINKDESIYTNDEFEKELELAMSDNDDFIELPQGIYGNANMSSDEFINFINDNINKFDDIQINNQLESDIDNDLDIIQINE